MSSKASAEPETQSSGKSKEEETSARHKEQQLLEQVYQDLDRVRRVPERSNAVNDSQGGVLSPKASLAIVCACGALLVWQKAQGEGAASRYREGKADGRAEVYQSQLSSCQSQVHSVESELHAQAATTCRCGNGAFTTDDKPTVVDHRIAYAATTKPGTEIDVNPTLITATSLPWEFDQPEFVIVEETPSTDTCAPRDDPNSVLDRSVNRSKCPSDQTSEVRSVASEHR